MLGMLDKVVGHLVNTEDPIMQRVFIPYDPDENTHVREEGLYIDFGAGMLSEAVRMKGIPNTEDVFLTIVGYGVRVAPLEFTGGSVLARQIVKLGEMRQVLQQGLEE